MSATFWLFLAVTLAGCGGDMNTPMTGQDGADAGGQSGGMSSTGGAGGGAGGTAPVQPTKDAGGGADRPVSDRDAVDSRPVDRPPSADVELASGACKTSADCPSDSYCAPAGGPCQASEAGCKSGVIDPYYCKASAGFCAPRPMKPCADIVQRVCGCDAKTYSNKCVALKAGIAVVNGDKSCEDFLPHQ